MDNDPQEGLDQAVSMANDLGGEVERLREALTTAEHELAAAAGVMRADGSIQNAQIAADAARFARAALDAARAATPDGGTDNA